MNPTSLTQLTHCQPQALQNEVRRDLDPGQLPGFKTWGFFSSTFSQCYLREPYRLLELTPFKISEDHENCFVGQWRPISSGQRNTGYTVGSKKLWLHCPVVMLDHPTGSCSLLKGILDPGTSRGSVSDAMASVTVWF